MCVRVYLYAYIHMETIMEQGRWVEELNVTWAKSQIFYQNVGVPADPPALTLGSFCFCILFQHWGPQPCISRSSAFIWPTFYH